MERTSTTPPLITSGSSAGTCLPVFNPDGRPLLSSPLSPRGDRVGAPPLPFSRCSSAVLKWAFTPSPLQKSLILLQFDSPCLIVKDYIFHGFCFIFASAVHMKRALSWCFLLYTTDQFLPQLRELLSTLGGPRAFALRPFRSLCSLGSEIPYL